MFCRSAILVAIAVADLAFSATIEIVAQAAYDKPDPLEFAPNEIIAAVGDVLEFHFAGPGTGVLGSNHSVAQGDFENPCNPAPNGFFSGYMAVNATSTEADMVFRVPVTSTDPMVFYCTQGTHCTRGMHGVVNGADDQTLQSYRRSITVNRNAVAPNTTGGGEMVPNNISRILPAETPGAACSAKASLVLILVGLGLALLIAQ
ncbi:hypothetical protein EPUS_04761 [Endocarpon pusillum Z07020]|uniref:Extracellular serine-rich protein n=1 Tax=Endocarpon pusillum (strain Z07020 / HMAS-L-300199) TaxID=1263415 RepID=U1GKJ0_ENDPU|nr:uncharacterized protein EPUS_04761 [Endocarpon pusillum Z07020]ERF72708.1 hypothetical protein EPUS_04761 [Endocarpon pusillum Z07020]